MTLNCIGNPCKNCRLRERRNLPVHNGALVGITSTASLSRRRPRRQRGRDDGSRGHIRRLWRRSVADGWGAGSRSGGGKPRGCRGTHSRGSPSDKLYVPPSGSLRRNGSCVQQGGVPRLAVQSSPTHRGIPVHQVSSGPRPWTLWQNHW